MGMGMAWDTAGGMAWDMAGDMAGGMGGTWAAVGTFPVGTFQSTVAAASLNSWAGIWSQFLVHILGHRSWAHSWDRSAYFYHHSTFFLDFPGPAKKYVTDCMWETTLQSERGPVQPTHTSCPSCS